ncbi:MAG: hypothetical protein ACKVRO_11830 [Micropepsaceae bacterium]
MLGQGRKNKTELLLLLTVAAGIAPAYAGDAGTLTMRGSLGAEIRAFTMRPAYALQDSDPVQGSIVANAKVSWTSANNDVVIDVAPFLRLDDSDDERTHGDLREAAVTVYSDHLDLRLGISKVYWGVTESRKLVDIVNQTDLVEEPEGDEKLGQPMIMLRGHVADFEAAVLVLPAFRPRTFPGSEGRLRPALAIDEDRAQYESAERTGRVDVAGRLKGRIDDVDIGLSYFSGTSREPRIVFDGTTLAPVYDVIDQAGLDVQATLDSTLLKLEAITRDGHRGTDARRFSAVTAGVEHTVSQVFDTACDVGLILEFNWDDRPDSAPPTIYDKDFFVGARFAFNDDGDSSALLGALIDAEKGSVYATIEASTRLYESLRIEVEGAFILHADERDTVLRQYRDDSFLSVRLTHYL